MYIIRFFSMTEKSPCPACQENNKKEKENFLWQPFSAWQVVPMISFSFFFPQSYTIISALAGNTQQSQDQDCWKQLKYGSYSNRFCILIQHVGYPEFSPPVVLSVGVCALLSLRTLFCVSMVSFLLRSTKAFATPLGGLCSRSLVSPQWDFWLDL